MTRRVATYDYPDAQGRVLLRKVRYEPKDFRMRARRAEGSVWVWPGYFERESPKARRYFAGLLYGLPELLDRPDEVWWTEGEKDADALWSVGVPAVSHWQGAVNATPAQAERFRRFRGRVVVVADLDGAGAACAVRRLDLLRSVGIPERRLRVVVADLWTAGSDAADHLDAGLTVEDFRHPHPERLRRAAARWERERGDRAGRRYDLSGLNIPAWRPRSLADVAGDDE